MSENLADFSTDASKLVKKFVKTSKNLVKAAKSAAKVMDFNKVLGDLNHVGKYLGEIGPYIMIGDLILGVHKKSQMKYLKEVMG